MYIPRWPFQTLKVWTFETIWQTTARFKESYAQESLAITNCFQNTGSRLKWKFERKLSTSTERSPELTCIILHPKNSLFVVNLPIRPKLTCTQAFFLVYLPQFVIVRIIVQEVEQAQLSEMENQYEMPPKDFSFPFQEKKDRQRTDNNACFRVLEKRPRGKYVKADTSASSH